MKKHFSIEEKDFLNRFKPDVVVCDLICWAIKAAYDVGIKILLIGNFTWSSMYKSFYEAEIYLRYLDYYRLADKALWYEIHDPELDSYVDRIKHISMVSRRVNKINRRSAHC